MTPDPAAHAALPTDPCIALPDRRGHERLTCPGLPEVCYLLRPSMREGRAMVRDLSAGGIGLFLSCPLDTGAVLLLQLPGPRGGTTHTQRARVAHTTAYQVGTWLVGCRLTPPLSGQDLARLRRQFTGTRG